MKLIVEIPEELHRKLKVKSAQDGITIKELVTIQLEKIVK